MFPVSSIALCTFAFAILASGLPAQGQVWVVDDDGGVGVDFTDIQPAAQAAAGGDTILVKEGSYNSFTVDGKGLTIHAEAGATVTGSGLALWVRVRNLLAGEVFVLRGFQPAMGSLEIKDCQGTVWVEDCVFLPYNVAGCVLLGGGYPGIGVEDSSDVIVVDCLAMGNSGHFYSTANWPGQPGLLAVNSQVSTFGCDFRGGYGGVKWFGLLCTSSGILPGAPGVSVDGGTVVMAGTNVTGGPGSASSCTIFGCGFTQPGGPGLETDCTVACTAPPVVWSVDSTIQGGPGATDLFEVTIGLAGPDTNLLSGTLVPLTGGGLCMSVSSPEREGTGFDLMMDGPPGVFTWLGIGLTPTAVFYPPYVGTVAVAPPHLFFPLGMIPASGTLSSTTPLGLLPPGVQSALAYGQSISLDASLGAVFVGEPSMILILDSVF